MTPRLCKIRMIRSIDRRWTHSLLNLFCFFDFMDDGTVHFDTRAVWEEDKSEGSRAQAMNPFLYHVTMKPIEMYEAPMPADGHSVIL